MESLIPIPWAHVIFGERALFHASRMIYDHPEFVPRHWGREPDGSKKPNKWRAWSSFKEQGFINELSLRGFIDIARRAGFLIQRLEPRGVGGSRPRRILGSFLRRLPVVGEYFISFVGLSSGGQRRRARIHLLACEK